MPDYKFRAALRNGKIVRGKLLASNKSQVITKLKESKLQPIRIKRMKEVKKKEKKFVNVNTAEYYNRVKIKPKVDFKNMTLSDLQKIEFHPFTRVTSKDIITFSNTLYILKKAKFNNIQALQSLFDGTENPVFKDIVEDLLIGVEAGERLCDVMSNYPKIFPTMYVNFIRVGEESGSLEDALLHAREYIESSIKLKKEIRKAIIPKLLQFFGIIILMMVGLVIGVPMIKEIYDTFDSTQEIPKATLVAFDITIGIINYWYIIVIAIALIILAFYIYISTPRGRYNFDRFKFSAPVFGLLYKNITVSKFFEAMLLNLKNGMRIQESLEVSKNVTNNYYFLSIVEVGKSNMVEGKSWIEPFEEKGIFRQMVIEMLTIGMKTDLTEMMEKVNEYIKSEISESLGKFVKVLPEITYSIVGVALIAFTLTVMVPIINIYMGSFIDMPS